DQPLIGSILCFFPIWVFGHELAIEVFGLLCVTTLPLTVCGKRQHLGLSSFRKLLLLFLVISEYLRVLAALILQAAQTDLRNRSEFSGFRQATAFLQQVRGSID